MKAAFYIDLLNQLRTCLKNWEFKRYGLNPCGLGDTAWREGLFLIAIWHLKTYTEEFKQSVLNNVLWYLHNRKRWRGNFDVKRRKGKKKYCQQHWYTKDQMITCMTALFFTKHYNEIVNIKMPWILSIKATLRPSTYWWLKFLKAHSQIMLLDGGYTTATGYLMREETDAYAKFHSWLRFELRFPTASYAIHLACLMVYCCPSEESSKILRKRFDSWNLLLRVLTGRITEITNDFLHEVNEFKTRSGYCWQRSELWDGIEENENDFFPNPVDIPFDKMVLDAFIHDIIGE